MFAAPPLSPSLLSRRRQLHVLHISDIALQFLFATDFAQEVGGYILPSVAML